MIQIWYTDPSCHVLPLYRVSSSSSHPFYRLPGPYLPFAGLFRRGPRDPSTSIASAAVLGEKDRKGPGKTVREGEAYRRSARRRRKLFGVVVHDMRGRDTELPPSPFLRLLVPSMGKRPGYSRSFSKERYGQTGQGRNLKICRQMSRVMYYLSAKFHGHPIMTSIGSPIPIFPLPVPPDLFRRGPREP